MGAPVERLGADSPRRSIHGWLGSYVFWGAVAWITLHDELVALGALAFGVFYGGSLVNGFERGVAYVSRISGKQDLSFDQ